MPSTARRTNGSRANSARSRGPKTEAGKARTRLNAVKTGAFAKSIILNNEATNPIERDLVEEMASNGAA